MQGYKKALSQAALIFFSLSPLVGGHALASEWKADPADVSDARVNSQLCMYFSTTVYGGPTDVDTAVVAYEPYTSNCAGVHTGSLRNLSSARLQLILQQFVGGSWVTVSNSVYTSYSGTAGTYRWIVWNTGNGTGYWSLDVRMPI